MSGIGPYPHLLDATVNMMPKIVEMDFFLF